MDRKKILFIIVCMLFLSAFAAVDYCLSGQLTETQAIQSLKSNNASHRLDAVHSLKIFKTDASVAALIEALNDSESFVRASAVVSLQFIGNSKAVSALIRVAEKDNEDPVVSKSAIIALGVFKDKKALPVLIKAAKSSDKGIKQAAVMALKGIEGDEAADVLLEAADDADANVRREAVSALGVKSESIKDSNKREKTRTKLEKISKNDTNPNVKRIAGDSIKRFNSKKPKKQKKESIK